MISRIAGWVVLFSVLVFVPSVTHAESNIEDIFNKAIQDLIKSGDEDKENSEQVRIPASRADIQLSFAPLVKEVSPSVVNVYAARKVVQQSPFAGDPFFERFFGKRGFGRPRARNQSSLGSGVMVSASGLVITNHHVIKGASEVKIALVDGREFECEIVLKDEQSDLAVLKVKDNETFQAIELGDSEGAQVGDLVLAIGNPFGVGQTVTSGIISAVARTRRGITDFGFFLQTDAAINPGNSGGALIDMQGRLIGIPTAIYSRSGGSNGIGFAIPSNMVQVILRSAETGDSVTRPWVGAGFQEVTSEIAASLGMSRPRGALVTSVTPGGPADQAGIAAGDVILVMNGNRIEHVDALGYRLATVGIGNTANLRILSRGNRREVSINLMAAPETVPREETDMPRDSALGGARVANLSPAVALEMKLPTQKTGVVVTRVQRPSYAAANGMRPGDIIREVNEQPVQSVGGLMDIVGRADKRWVFVVERAGREFVFEREGGFFRQYAR